MSPRQKAVLFCQFLGEAKLSYSSNRPRLPRLICALLRDMAGRQGYNLYFSSNIQLSKFYL